MERLILESEGQHPLTIEQKAAIVDGLYEEARLLGHFSPRAVDRNLEVEIKMARILNANVPATSRRH